MVAVGISTVVMRKFHRRTIFLVSVVLFTLFLYGFATFVYLVQTEVRCSNFLVMCYLQLHF